MDVFVRQKQVLKYMLGVFTVHTYNNSYIVVEEDTEKQN